MAKKRKDTSEAGQIKAAMRRLKVSETQTHIDKKQERFIIVFGSNMCNIAETCKAVKICRQTYYNWLANDQNFALKVYNAREAMLDKLEETALNMAIEKNNTAMVIFLLKTQAVQRGYQENKKVSVQVTNKQTIKLGGNSIEF